jgi:hypothetical protein
VTASDALLCRIHSDPELAELLIWPADFDITRLPENEFILAGGAPTEPIGGCGGGGTYLLCGAPSAAARPVLYADSEGQASLIGQDLTEAITLMVQFPFWYDLGLGHPCDELATEYDQDRPEWTEIRDRIMAMLDLEPLTPAQARDRLLSVAARTAPDYVPTESVPAALPYRFLFDLQA